MSNAAVGLSHKAEAFRPAHQLVPSQAGRNKNRNSNNNPADNQRDNKNKTDNQNKNAASNPKNRNRNRNRRRKNAANNNANEGNSNANSPPIVDNSESNAVAAAQSATNADDKTGDKRIGNNKNGKRRQKQRGNNKTNGSANNENGDDATNQNNDNNANNSNSNNKTAKRKNNRKKNKKKYPWRKYIPEGTVDPITLDNLCTLEYPPFALCADEPYIPIPEWPIVSNVEDNSSKNQSSSDNGNNNTSATTPPQDADAINRQRLADQWGEHMLEDDDDDKKKPNNDPSSSNVTPLSQRPMNLFDGRALAFYMVSQLQFIDPFTRRDLTRAELENLDRYLDKYGRTGTTVFETGKNGGRQRKNKKEQKKLNVTDAYDAKGITLSSAGATASTAQGRADIMQQMAQQLLNSLFVGQPSVTSMNGASTTTSERMEERRPTSLQEQYAATQRLEAPRETQHRGFEATQHDFFSEDADAGAYRIIDDDENPEMRGRNDFDFPTLTPDFPSLTPAATANNRIGGGAANNPVLTRYGGQRITTGSSEAFPALAPPTGESATIRAAAAKKSKTLSKILGVVKKTTAAEKQSQWEAREAARRRALNSNMTTGNHLLQMMPPSVGVSTTSDSVTEEQLQRNRAFAEALDVKPALQRYNSLGWARPTTSTEEDDANQSLRNELEAVLYPDALIVSAREHRMDFLVKLEKRLKRFLSDDKASSHNLNKMNRTARAFVHHYLEFWNLKTESFDLEPNRYINCAKLPGTRMPNPLLSDVARHWRGPSTATVNLDSLPRGPMIGAVAPTATQSAPKLRPATALSSSKHDLVAFGEAEIQNSRSDALMDKERPKLDLLPRTVPLELPPHDQEAAVQLSLDEDLRKRRIRLEEKRKREREAEQKKKKVLEDAFASDDENDNTQGAGFLDKDNEWGDVQEALYTGSDEEE